MNPGLRILILTDGLSPWVTGGMQQHSSMLVKHLAAFSEYLVVAYCGEINRPVPEGKEVRRVLGLSNNVRLIGIPFIDQGKFPGHYVRASKRFSRQLAHAIENVQDFDIVYAQGFAGWAFRGHPGLVVNLHGLEMFQTAFSFRERLTKYLLKPIARSLIRSAKINVSLGGKLTNILLGEGIDPLKIAEIPNGIPGNWLCKHPKPRIPGPLKVLLIGRNEPRKGYDLLQSALSSMGQQIMVDVVGPWPKFTSGKHQVQFHGEIRSREGIQDRIDASDVLVVPSRAEGMPTVILEALARGRHVIATDVGATAALLSHAPSCKLIQPEVSALKDALEAFALSPPDPERFDLSRFMWSRIAMDHMRIFQKLADKRYA